MIYAIISNQKIIKYPVILSEEFPNTSFSDVPNKESLVEFGIIIVKEMPTPDFNAETHTIEESEPILIDDEWVQSWKINSLV
jgi:hypothetical protein